ncbi:MAG: hypothetical protein KF729_31100 [Sandaracinaceae bacterium]|nr:hypothetical protein [Sandaracinaceae bacterium]
MGIQRTIDDARLRATFEAAGAPGAQAEAVLEERAEGLSDERSLALVAIDADAVQRTLLASPRPVTIAGASATLQQWDRDLRKHDEVVPSEATVLFAGGGTAVVLAPARAAASLGAKLERAYAERMHARATAAHVAVSPRELVSGPRALTPPVDGLARLGLRPGGGGFGGCMANLAFALRTAKSAARAHFDVTEATSVARCAETGDRPRAPGHDAKGDPWTVSEFARGHREAGRKEKAADEQARSLDDLLKRAKARRLAFICIDGAKIGTLLTGLTSLREYVGLSSTLDDAFSSVLLEDVQRELGIRPREHQVILAGGDDLLLVVPAEGRGERPNALELTRRIARRIEGAFADGPRDGKVGVGAGVLITSGGLPSRIAFDYARALCDSAKRAIDDVDRSGVDFEVVLAGAPLSSSIASLREARERTTDSFPKMGQSAMLRDTQCPYAIGRFEGLLAVAEALHEAKVGQSTLAAYTRALEQGELNTALIDVYYQLARDRTGHVREALGVTSLEPDAPSEWIARQVSEPERVWATGLRDLVEVTKLMRRR